MKKDSQNVNEVIIDKLMALAPTEGHHATPISGLHITRWDHPGQHDPCLFSPSITLVLQGEKESIVGANTYRYGALECAVTSVNMPVISGVVKATPNAPMISLTIMLEQEPTNQIVTDLIRLLPIPDGVENVVSVGPAGKEVIDVFERMVSILDAPQAISLMSHLLLKEAITRILVGPHGNALRSIYKPTLSSKQIATAVEWLSENYTQALQIEKLAKFVGSGTSTFHRKFKKITSMSPLQYQKRLRLYEARRLMIADHFDANTAAEKVGYESAQQFNREYKRMFGEPPLRDINRLRRK
ncbi:AraC family transcriptional regulator [Vibrio natriegens]|uniref:AraC family transcriptional regulator n=1 Tax=Vibrio natriegens TaxID=691 RepID=UPI0035569D91